MSLINRVQDYLVDRSLIAEERKIFDITDLIPLLGIYNFTVHSPSWCRGVEIYEDERNNPRDIYTAVLASYHFMMVGAGIFFLENLK